MKENCPNSKSMKHYYVTVVQTKADFEPTQYGQSAADTLYKRVEYTILACSCGEVKKERVAISPL